MARKSVHLALLLSAVVMGFAVGRYRDSTANRVSRQPLYYVDPMHRDYRSNKPGIAPDCGMQLVAVYSEDISSALTGARTSPSGQIRISAASQQLYGIQLTSVRRSSAHEVVRVFGRVTADETALYRVNLGTDGYVKETANDAVGKIVKKNQHLAVVYSPEFLTVAGGYLSANERTITGMPKDNSAANPNAASAQARADRLRNLGMSDTQIAELSTTRKIPEDVYVVSPVDGVIISRNISPGLRFERHTDLYTIGDLSRVWVLAEVSPNEGRLFRPGMTARLAVPGSNESVAARVSDALPEVDSVSHQMKIRLEVNNPGFRLRPETYVTIELSSVAPSGLSIPLDAVINSGDAKHVFIRTSPGTFEQRAIRTGWSTNDTTEVIEGLKEGDEVVSNGTFLIDSESKLRVYSDQESGQRDRAPTRVKP